MCEAEGSGVDNGVANGQLLKTVQDDNDGDSLDRWEPDGSDD